MKKFEQQCKGAAKLSKATWNVSKGAAKKIGAYNKRTKLVHIPKM